MQTIKSRCAFVARLVAFTLIACMLSGAAVGGVCAYRPSIMAGKAATAATGIVGGATALAGVGLNAAGYYTLIHSVTGATMLGSTAAGASAAGTTGIIAGTGSGIGAAAAFVMSPLVIVPAAVAAITVVTYEGGCYLAGQAPAPAVPAAPTPAARAVPATPPVTAKR